VTLYNIITFKKDLKPKAIVFRVKVSEESNALDINSIVFSALIEGLILMYIKQD
jgi:hypothetical protein